MDSASDVYLRRGFSYLILCEIYLPNYFVRLQLLQNHMSCWKCVPVSINSQTTKKKICKRHRQKVYVVVSQQNVCKKCHYRHHHHSEQSERDLSMNELNRSKDDHRLMLKIFLIVLQTLF